MVTSRRDMRRTLHTSEREVYDTTTIVQLLKAFHMQVNEHSTSKKGSAGGTLNPHARQALEGSL